MQVRSVFTQVGTGFFCVVTASCAGKLAGQAREAPAGSAPGFSPGALLAIARLKSAKNLYFEWSCPEKWCK